MSVEESESTAPILLCLVADDKAIERFPTAIRYLQVGLTDEAIDTLLLVPELSPPAWLETGRTTVMRYRRYPWPFTHFGERALVASIKQQVEALPREPYVIVHGLTLTVAPLAAALAKAMECELLLSVTSTGSLQNPELQAAIAQASTLVVPTQPIRQAVLTSSFARKQMEHIPLGVFSENSPAAFSQADRSPTIVFTGALTEDSGVDTLLRAAKRVIQRNPDLLVFIIGKGPAETYLRQLAQSLGISMNVTFTGRIDHWHEAMQAADVFCLPRASMPFQEEPIHALACGLAIVAAESSKYDGMTDEETALLFPANDEEALAEQIICLLENRDLGRKLGTSAQAYARKNHSVANMVTQYARIYRQLVSRESTLPIGAAR